MAGKEKYALLLSDSICTLRDIGVQGDHYGYTGEIGKMDFNRLTMLREKLADDVNRLEELKDMKYSPSAPVITGMPKESGFSSDGGRVARIATEITVMEETIQNDKIRIVQELKRLELLINAIPDSRIRVGLTMHYIFGETMERYTRRVER